MNHRQIVKTDWFGIVHIQSWDLDL